MLGGSNAALFGEADEFSHGFSLHLLHNPATVNFYRRVYGGRSRYSLFNRNYYFLPGLELIGILNHIFIQFV